jgi:hypothetical protein
MAKHKIITIKVAYDEAHDIPSDEYLRLKVQDAVGDGLLSSDEADTIVEEWDVDVHNPIGLVYDKPREVAVRLTNRALVEAADNAVALNHDEKVYRLTIDIDESETGPSMKKGWLVRIIDSNPEYALVETIEEHWDSGTGCNDGTEGYHTSSARVDWSDIEEV